MFEFLFRGLAWLNLQTALTEACDWDEEHAEVLMSGALDAINECNSMDELPILIEKRLSNIATEEQVARVLEVIMNEISVATKDLVKDEPLN